MRREQLRRVFLFGSWMLAASAYASYAQMRLDGLGLLLAFVLTVFYGLLVDLGVLIRIFRYRTALVIGSVIAAGVAFVFLSQAASPSERVGFFKGAPGGAELVVVGLTSLVLLPFMVIAPLAQYLSMRHGQGWPRWITAWMVLQLALIPVFLVLAATERYFWERDYAAGEAEGRAVEAGGLGGILGHAGERRERTWGTVWPNPWQQKPPAGLLPRDSGWILGLAKSLDASPLMAAGEPLSAPDRAALRALMSRHFVAYAVPNIRTKLVWDALEPGGFARQLAPRGVSEPGTVAEEVVPVLLERLEKHGEARLCPGGRMMDADRAVLNALVLEKGRVWSVEKRAHEMRPEWEGYPQRVERLCSR